MDIMINWWLGNLFLIVFYGFYRLFLMKSFHFKWNRLYLIATPIISFLLPYVGVLIPVQPNSELSTVMLETITVISETTQPVTEENTFSTGVWVYAIGALLFLSKLIWTSTHLSSLIVKSKKEKKDGYVLIHAKDKAASFSFFKYVHIQPDLNNAEQQAVLHHELVHVNSGHSFDILYFELLLTLLWFNPVVYLFRRAIREVHEFAADSKAAKNREEDYSQMLIARAMGVTPSVIVNPFFNESLLKRRIIMLTNKKKQSFWKYTLLLPLVLGLIYTSSCTKTEETSADNLPIKEAQDPTFKQNEVDVLPEYDGGNQAMFAYIGKNLKYPKEAKESGAAGMVYIGFVVGKDGAVKEVEVLRSVDSHLDEAAVNIVKQMPKWTPGKKDGKNVDVKMTLPIRYELKDE